VGGSSNYGVGGVAGDGVMDVVAHELDVVGENGVEDIHHHFAVSFTNNGSILEGLFAIENVGGMDRDIAVLSGAAE